MRTTFLGIARARILGGVCLSLPTQSTQSTQQVSSAFSITPESNHVSPSSAWSHLVSHLSDHRPASSSADSSEQQLETLFKQNALHDPRPLPALSHEEGKPPPFHGLKDPGGCDRHFNFLLFVLSLLATLRSWLLLEPPQNIPSPGPLPHGAPHPACSSLMCSPGSHPPFPFSYLPIEEAFSSRAKMKRSSLAELLSPFPLFYFPSAS